jgi:hypothetical protein
MERKTVKVKTYPFVTVTTHDSGLQVHVHERDPYRPGHDGRLLENATLRFTEDGHVLEVTGDMCLYGCTYWAYDYREGLPLDNRPLSEYEIPDSMWLTRTEGWWKKLKVRYLPAYTLVRLKKRQQKTYTSNTYTIHE